ncbi:hypothetical protein CEXT_377321 [Caerostris extrusa]|uniref:Uncharacterized protein n=1 Tax=Caerostris extrusa TaxID=172846 RepID=A0AAV4MRG1_CAEEX|nr:hypothetical protein CEXT_377321 [Caerostris extrusa]
MVLLTEVLNGRPLEGNPRDVPWGASVFLAIDTRAASVSELSAPPTNRSVEGYCPHFGCGQSVAPAYRVEATIFNKIECTLHRESAVLTQYRSDIERNKEVMLAKRLVTGSANGKHLEDLMELYGDEKSLEENQSMCLRNILSMRSTTDFHPHKQPRLSLQEIENLLSN